MTDRVHSCPDSPDGKHHWRPYIPMREIQEQAYVLSQKHGGDYQLQSALAISVDSATKELRAQQMLECEHCGRQRMGDYVPVPQEVVDRMKSGLTTH